MRPSRSMSMLVGLRSSGDAAHRVTSSPSGTLKRSSGSLNGLGAGPPAVRAAACTGLLGRRLERLLRRDRHQHQDEQHVQRREGTSAHKSPIHGQSIPPPAGLVSGPNSCGTRSQDQQTLYGYDSPRNIVSFPPDSTGPAFPLPVPGRGPPHQWKPGLRSIQGEAVYPGHGPDDDVARGVGRRD